MQNNSTEKYKIKTGKSNNTSYNYVYKRRVLICNIYRIIDDELDKRTEAFNAISISSKILPNGGTAMFTYLALAGDLGGAVGPAIIGNVSQMTANNLQAGVLAGAGFPLVLAIAVLYVRKKYR